MSSSKQLFSKINLSRTIYFITLMIAVFISYKYGFINLNTDKNIIAFIGVVLSILTSPLLTAITTCSDITFITAQNRY